MHSFWISITDPIQLQGGVFTGLALNPQKISDVIGVVKASRVGSGPFLSGLCLI
jgi:adenylosuccinate synthase